MAPIIAYIKGDQPEDWPNTPHWGSVKYVSDLFIVSEYVSDLFIDRV